MSQASALTSCKALCHPRDNTPNHDRTTTQHTWHLDCQQLQMHMHCTKHDQATGAMLAGEIQEA